MFLTWSLFLKKEKDIPDLLVTIVPCCYMNVQMFSIAKEDDVRQGVVRKPVNKEVKKPRIKVPEIQCFVISRVLQHTHECIALKKQCTKKNEDEAIDFGKLLARKMP